MIPAQVQLHMTTSRHEPFKGLADACDLCLYSDSKSSWHKSIAAKGCSTMFGPIYPEMQNRGSRRKLLGCLIVSCRPTASELFCMLASYRL